MRSTSPHLLHSPTWTHWLGGRWLLQMNATCFTFPSSAPGQAAWVADPSCRGTFSIALLCFSTTLICIWSAVHRDIPLQRISTFRSLLRDVPLVLVALFAPELLFYFALNQFLSARNLVKIAEKSGNFQVSSNTHEGEGDYYQHLQSESKENVALDNIEMGRLLSQDRVHDDSSTIFPPPQNIQFSMTQGPSRKVRKYPFTLKHGFYATMGGFAFKQSVSEDGRWCSRPLKLKVRAIKFVMQHEPDLIPDLPITSITDRSKSNSLGKALLVVQVAWFCLNCASRLAERLPLCLLEVSTLAHGLFTLSSCAMWWSKPLSIDEPTWISLSDDRAKELLALLQALSNNSGKERETFLDEWRADRHHINSTSKFDLALRASTRYPVSKMSNGCALYTTDDSVPTFNDLFYGVGFRRTSFSLSVGSLIDCVVTTCIPFIYGFLHLLALRAQFPTPIERDLWRIASVAVMSSGAFEALFEAIRDVCIDGLALSWSFQQVVDRLRVIVNFRILPILYVFCSGYLLVQSIRQLWYLPHDAYVVASWSYYIPHWL